MIGLILVTHGRLAEEFVAAMEHVVGPQSAIATICIGPNDDMERRRKDIARAIAEVDNGRGAIMLTDLFGGTPSNLAISLLEPGRTEVIAGINLPMLIRLAGARKEMTLARAIAEVDSGRGAIMLTDLFGGTPSNLAISLLEPGRTEVIAGINLPMLIRLAGARKEMALARAAEAARDAGRTYITVASEFLGQTV